MSNKPRSIFLTGITGALGREILKKMLTTTEDVLFVLVRRKQRMTHWDRMRKIMAADGLERHLGTRVQVLEGDVTLPGLGLTELDLARLRANITIIYHIAALTALNGTEQDCRTINVGGTEKMLAFAWDLRRNGKLERFFYFSTAYAAGSCQTYCSREDVLPEHPAFANYYEATKYASETKVREAIQEELPATIFRPSIVVGDSTTGEVSEFNVIYPFMKMFVHGMLSKLPTRPDNAFNIVPVDFVVNAALAIAEQKSSVGKAYHLVTNDPPPIRYLMELREKEYPEVAPVEMIDPDNFKKEKLDPSEQFIYDMLKPYLGYLNGTLTFDTTNTRKALEGTGIEFPKTGYEFLRTLVRYAVNEGYLVVQ
jgi:thioester reductase-like protein